MQAFIVFMINKYWHPITSMNFHKKTFMEFYVSELDITETETKPQEHFSNYMQMPDTWENHWNVPLNCNILWILW
jgi:hypothetical protein